MRRKGAMPPQAYQPLLLLNLPHFGNAESICPCSSGTIHRMAAAEVEGAVFIEPRIGDTG